MTTTPDPELVRTALARVIDPEIGTNIVDLGLVYRIDCSPGRIHIELTMTSPACPMGDLIVDDALTELAFALPGQSADIQLVWEPPWTPAMMSAACRERLGWQAPDAA